MCRRPTRSTRPDTLFPDSTLFRPPGQARRLLDEAIHVLAAIGARLARAGSPYSTIFAVLRGMTDVVPREQTEPPVRDMDEAMEAYGVGADGVEPLLPLAAAGTHVVHFHPRPRGAQQ